MERSTILNGKIVANGKLTSLWKDPAFLEMFIESLFMGMITMKRKTYDHMGHMGNHHFHSYNCNWKTVT